MVDCSTSFGNHGCNGGLYDYAFDYAYYYAEELEGDYPYEGYDARCRYAKASGKVNAKNY